MKFYNSVGPNPRVVRMFMAERGIEVPRVEVDLRGGENRRVPYMAKNPAGQLPCLELDDGSVLAEITAICEYLDETAPGGGPSLIGATPLERAECRMWARRVDLNVAEPLANGYRFSEGLKLFENRTRCLPEAAAGLKLMAQDKLRWLDGPDGRAAPSCAASGRPWPTSCCSPSSTFGGQGRASRSTPRSATSCAPRAHGGAAERRGLTAR
jgi:glutathione S-transferase